MPPEPPVVLVVEDEPDVAETYELWLADEYDVRRAGDGATALDRLDEAVDVVLLDRMLPGMSGAEVLARIRERGADCRVAMVTAVDPDFDVIEMGFDEYVTKPPTKADLHETVARLLDRATLDDDLQEYYSLVARRSALETEFTREELADHEAYDELVDRIDRQRAAVDERLGDMGSDTAFIGAVREIMDGEAADPPETAPGEDTEDTEDTNGGR